MRVLLLSPKLRVASVSNATAKRSNVHRDLLSQQGAKRGFLSELHPLSSTGFQTFPATTSSLSRPAMMDEDDSPAAASLLQQRYQKLEKIGQGTYGKV